MVRRTLLFTPGDRPDRLRNAPTTGADVVVFDLEDAVSPNRKQKARADVSSVLSDPVFDPDCEVCVRVNADRDAIDTDLEVLLDDSSSSEPRLDSIMLPKVSSRDDICHLASRLESWGRESPILALVETPASVLAAPEIASCSQTDALVFGAEDLAAGIGATRTAEGTEVLYARERIVLAAAANDIDAVDTVYTDFDDESGLREETTFAVQLGYDGKLAIHPSQIEPIHDSFAPDADDIEWARAVLEAKPDADRAGDGVFEVDGEMIDGPLIKQAERILQRAGIDDRSD